MPLNRHRTAGHGEAGSGGNSKNCGPQDQAPVARHVATEAKKIAAMGRRWPTEPGQV